MGVANCKVHTGSIYRTTTHAMTSTIDYLNCSLYFKYAMPQLVGNQVSLTATSKGVIN